MLKKNWIIGWRHITRNKFYTTVNVLGLSLGIGACLVIYLLVSYELSFDRSHKDSDRIYRVMGDVTENTGDKLHFARIPFVVSQAAHTTLSGLDAVGSYIHYRTPGTPSNTIVIAEPNYFSIFQYDWLAGNAATSLSAPFTVVLTESRARQYFGPVPADKLIGKKIVYDDSLSLTVSGIIKDQDKNTDLAFTDFISFATIRSSFLSASIKPDSWDLGDLAPWTFVKLSPGTTPARINAQLADFVHIHADPQLKLKLWLQPLSDMHFFGDVVENPIRTAHKPTLFGLMAIAVFILLLAIINFVNLSTAQSIRRAKEIGVRKVLGSSRSGLVLQFLTETMILTLFSTLLGLLLVKPTLYFFRSFLPPGLSFRLLDPTTMIVLTVTTFTTALLAGWYPAKVLSSYAPALSLAASSEIRGGHQWLLRKGLIVFQFTVSLVFIIGSIVIADQLKYARNIDPGFNADAILTVETPRGDSLSKITVLKEMLRKIPGIDQVALQWVSPMTDNTRGMRLKIRPTDKKDIGVTQVAGNESFIPLYQIHLLAGRNLTASDSVNEFVINEILARKLGYSKPDQTLGATVYWNDRPYPIVGVVADFHTKSLHDPITPLCIINRREREGTIAIKLASKGKRVQMIMITAVLARAEKAWKSVYPEKAFSYRFYDESLALLYEKDSQTATLINTSMGIAIFISCIGLFGLALFTAEKRAKEVSIRKILGASVESITFLLCKDFVFLVIIALITASPIAWYGMNRWLQSFAFHIDIGMGTFITAGAAAIFIALLTVAWQAVRAAMANPIKNLKTE
jgi:putative ABC transport system permease protein